MYPHFYTPSFPLGCRVTTTFLFCQSYPRSAWHLAWSIGSMNACDHKLDERKEEGLKKGKEEEEKNMKGPFY